VDSVCAVALRFGSPRDYLVESSWCVGASEVLDEAPKSFTDWGRARNFGRWRESVQASLLTFQRVCMLLAKCIFFVSRLLTECRPNSTCVLSVPLR
jgi:hypothetical protein